MNASYRFVVTGALPIGAFLGGILGDLLGLRPAMWVGGMGLLCALLWVVFSPVRRLRDLPHKSSLPC